MILALLTAGLGSAALAQPQDSARVVSGEDIVAWRALPQDDPQALRGFIQEYPSSPLAERAFTRLQELDQEAGVLAPGAQRSLASSADSHYRVLTRPSGSVFVATLSMSAPSTPSPLPALRPRVELGAATWGTELGLSVGAGVQGRYLGAMARTRMGQAYGEIHLAARAELPLGGPWTPYSELMGARRFRGELLSPWAMGGALGVNYALSERVGLQGSAEFWQDARVGLHAALRYNF